MTTQRFNNVPIKLERLTDDDAIALREAVLERVVTGFSELQVCEGVLMERGLMAAPQEPIEEGVVDQNQLTFELGE